MQRTEEQIESILSSVDGIRRAEARPYMFTRIMARLQAEDNFWSKSTSFIARPVIAFACLATVVAANIYFVATRNNENTETEQELASTGYSSNTNNDLDIIQANNYVLTANNY